MKSKNVIIFDGVCNFCNGAVNFIIKHDSNKIFSFTPMQSDLAKELIEKYKIDNVGFDTFLLIKNNKCYLWTDAALEITRDLTGFWRVLIIFKIIPRPIRDYFYRLFARNRYALFGRKESCMVPSDDVKSRFVGI